MERPARVTWPGPACAIALSTRNLSA